MKARNLTALVAVMAWSMAANAISLRYNFKVFSSGPNIYACNAGILAPESNRRVCYFQGTNQTCSATSASDSSCICSSVNGGEYLMNYGKVTYQDWKDNGDTSVTGQVRDAPFRAANTGVWSQALTDSASWGKRITNLSFNLGSELYSAQYFVDVCYRGPQIEYFEDNVRSSYSLKAQAFATDFLATGPNSGENSRDGLVIPGLVDGKKYTELAGLTVQAFVTCDMQGAGSFRLARNNSNAYNTADNEAGFAFGSNKLPNGATEGSGSFWASSVRSINASVADLMNPWLAIDSTRVPRFCKVRYVFTETDYLSALPNLRKWQRHGAEMSTHTEINEDAILGALN
ncbi:MAG: protease [Bdellovibrionales bacterium]